MCKYQPPVKIIFLKAILSTIIFFVNISGLQSEEIQRRELPTKLFGVEVGKIYSTKGVNQGSIGNLPIQKIAGMQNFLGSGFHIYFKPLKNYPHFEYVEKKKAKNDKFYETSFRLYVFPLIPDNIDSLKKLQLDYQNFDIIVGLVEWSQQLEEKDKSYYKALDFCNIFKSDFLNEPSIYDYHSSKWYTCTFKGADRVLDIRNRDSVIYVTLKMPLERSEKIEKSIENRINQLKARSIIE